jgi:hypothetical protein
MGSLFCQPHQNMREIGIDNYLGFYLGIGVENMPDIGIDSYLGFYLGIGVQCS